MIKKSCSTCEWNFGTNCSAGVKDPETGEDLYGAPMKEMRKRFSGHCDYWEISLSAYIRLSATDKKIIEAEWRERNEKRMKVFKMPSQTEKDGEVK